MEENNVKIAYAKNLNKLNFNSTISMTIDSNVNIKSILDISSYLFDQRVECGSGKAIVTGKLGLKVLYIDTDNITNTLSDSQSFSETILDNSITSDCYINIANTSIANHILSSDGTLKINCDINIAPILYLNLSIHNNLTAFESMMVKKSELNTNTISNLVDTSFEYTTNIETKDRIAKILYHNAYFSPEKTTANEEYAIVEGKIYSSLIYEATEGEETVIRQHIDTHTVKSDVNIAHLPSDCTLDLSFSLDRSREDISTEMEDDTSIITIKHNIKATGVALKEITIDVVDDAYSTENEVELALSNREYTKRILKDTLSEVVSNEITLSDNETAIDDILANLDISPEITNSYIKDETLYIEGIISSNLAYIDENKEYKHKQIESPFIINTKINMSTLHSLHNTITVTDCKTKAKRGTIVELEYSLFISLAIYEKESKEMVDNFTLGKPYDFGAYDYQIFLAKPNETIWELCKRIKISTDDIYQYNKNLPLIMEGGEKVVIKR
ncbi:MAG: DUF3794 domain-containing protein [Clostridiales bacterium]|nr:DUF3794 domain-containing protein [Clostridiales bacterium]